MKPVADQWLEAALSPARASLVSGQDGSFGRHIEAAADRHSPGVGVSEKSGPHRLAIPLGDRVVIVRVSDIDWVEACGNYVSLHVEKKTWLLRETIARMQRQLEPHGFARIHRSTLVNFDRVLELRTLGTGDFTVILRDGTILKLSRHYRPSLKNVVTGIFNQESS